MTRYIKSPKVQPMVEMAVRYPEFAERLTKAMTEVGLEIVDIKERLGVTYEMARRYTLGTAMPREPRLKKLAGLVGKSPSWLAFGVDAHLRTEPAASREDVVPYRTSPPWPLKKSTAARLGALAPAQLRQVDDMVDAVLRGFEAEGRSPKSSP